MPLPRLPDLVSRGLWPLLLSMTCACGSPEQGKDSTGAAASDTRAALEARVSELCGALEACADDHKVPSAYANRAACVDEKLKPFSLPLVTDACRTAGERLHACLLRESRCQFFPSERVCDEDYCEDTDPYATLVHEKTQCVNEWEAYGTECPVIG